MPPAIRPPCSWSVPTLAEIVETVLFSKASGRAPYFRTFARSFAVWAVKLPSMTARPSGIWPLTCGLE